MMIFDGLAVNKQTLAGHSDFGPSSKTIVSACLMLNGCTDAKKAFGN